MVPYEDRIKFLNLSSLEVRRQVLDLSHVFAIFKGILDCDVTSLFTLHEGVTRRANRYKLKVPRARSELLKNIQPQSSQKLE